MGKIFQLLQRYSENDCEEGTCDGNIVKKTTSYVTVYLSSPADGIMTDENSAEED